MGRSSAGRGHLSYVISVPPGPLGGLGRFGCFAPGTPHPSWGTRESPACMGPGGSWCGEGVWALGPPPPFYPGPPARHMWVCLNSGTARCPNPSRGPWCCSHRCELQGAIGLHTGMCPLQGQPLPCPWQRGCGACPAPQDFGLWSMAPSVGCSQPGAPIPCGSIPEPYVHLCTHLIFGGPAFGLSWSPRSVTTPHPWRVPSVCQSPGQDTSEAEPLA